MGLQGAGCSAVIDTRCIAVTQLNGRPIFAMHNSIGGEIMIRTSKAYDGEGRIYDSQCIDT